MSEQLADLLARVKAATGPDREIDILIDQRVDPEGRIVKTSSLENVKRALEYFEKSYVCEQCGQADQSHNPLRLSHYTSSIDACVSLAERVLPGWAWHIQKVDVNAMKSFASVWIPSQRTHGLRIERADSDMGMETPAVALLAAIISALLAKDQSS